MVKRCIILSCPCPHVRSISLMRLTAPLSSSPDKPVLDALPYDVAIAGSPPRRHWSKPTTPSTSCCSPSWSFRALRRFIAVAATHVPAKLSPHSHAHWVYLPSFAASSGFRTPSTLLSAICLPALFRAGSVLGLPSFGGFSPTVAPATSRSPVSSLSFLRLRGRDSEDVSIGWMRCCRSRD